MSTAQRLAPISVAEYLQGEENANRRHEFVEGVVYAMVGAKNRHNRISISASASLYFRLRDNPCEAFNSDVKVRIRQTRGTRFYYPNAMVVCRPNSETDTFQDAPVVIVEVISESTRRIDETEKRDGYLSIDSLCVYIRVEQSTPFASVDRRTDEGFVREQYDGLTAVIPLPEIGIELPLAELYEGVKFPPEKAEDELDD